MTSGTLTLLCTDIEGSTRLLRELADGYAAALAEHRRVLREVFARHGGVEVDTQGDAFFIAFADPTEAVSAAAEAQAALAPGPVRVRMGFPREGRLGRKSVTSASTCTSGRGSRLAGTGARCCCRRRPRSWSRAS